MIANPSPRFDELRPQMAWYDFMYPGFRDSFYQKTRRGAGGTRTCVHSYAWLYYPLHVPTDHGSSVSFAGA